MHDGDLSRYHSYIVAYKQYRETDSYNVKFIIMTDEKFTKVSPFNPWKCITGNPLKYNITKSVL